jgi:hypothetical protein
MLGDRRRSTIIKIAKYFGFIDEFIHKSMFLWPAIPYALSMWNASLRMSRLNGRVL